MGILAYAAVLALPAGRPRGAAAASRWECGGAQEEAVSASREWAQEEAAAASRRSCN